MPTFDTPAPISVTAEFGVGDLRVAAADRTDTVVEVRPSDPTRKADVAAAEQTRVEYANGALVVKAPKGWRYIGPRKDSGSVDIVIELPARLAPARLGWDGRAPRHGPPRRMPLQHRPRGRSDRRGVVARDQDGIG